jgi:2-aminoadipate transaminase
MNISKLSPEVAALEGSPIRALFKYLGQPGFISFAGGAPDPELFQLEKLAEMAKNQLLTNGKSILQYGVTEGREELRTALAGYLQSTLPGVTPEQIQVAHGAQAAITALSIALLTPEDHYAVENPSFLASLAAFKLRSSKVHGIERDSKRLDLDQLEEVAKANSLKFFYTVPNYHNPTGGTLSLEERQRLVELAQRYDFLIIEDNPYAELNFSGEKLTSLWELAPESVVYVGSLSKVMSPGLREGYVVAPGVLGEKLLKLRQILEVHANQLGQAIAAEYITSGELTKDIPLLISAYKQKLDTLVAELKSALSADFKYVVPTGGMFLWIEGPQGFDAEKLSAACLEEKVAVVPGKHFYVDHSKLNTLRLNFTNVKLSDIPVGVAKLKAALERL